MTTSTFDRRAVLEQRIRDVEAALHEAELNGPRYRVMSLRGYLARLRHERDGEPDHGALALLRWTGERVAATFGAGGQAADADPR